MILPSAKQNHGPRIAALPKVRLIEAPELSEGAWFPRCTVLSDAATAAPSFVAGALGELAPNYVRLPGRTLYVARRRDVAAHRVICALADTSEPGKPELLPTNQDHADLVLALADAQAGLGVCCWHAGSACRSSSATLAGETPCGPPTWAPAVPLLPSPTTTSPTLKLPCTDVP